MFKALPTPLVSTATALGLAALLAMQAEAAASGEPQPLAALPGAVVAFLRGSAVFFLAPVAVAVALWHRPIVSHLHGLAIRAAIRLSALRPAPEAREPHCPLAPAKHLAQGGDLAEEVKLRMTEVHRQIRRLAPELLPVYAECRAAQARLLRESRHHPQGLPEAEALLIGALVQIETATRKLSVVLPDATKEYALGSYADTLEKLTGEALDCLSGLRSPSKGAQGLQIGGEAGHA